MEKPIFSLSVIDSRKNDTFRFQTHSQRSKSSSIRLLVSLYWEMVSCSAATTQSPHHYRLSLELINGPNDFQISLIFLPFGVGSLISAFTTGRIIDWNFRRHARRLGVPVEKGRQRDLIDFPIERARMEVAIPMVLLGASGLLCYGWLIAQRVSGTQ